MPFCSNCGQQLVDGVNFCSNCGAEINNPTNVGKRKAVFEGEVHKCPNCGETIEAFEAICPSCGYEFRGTKASETVKDFAQKIEDSPSEKRKIDIIRSYPIPNNKEDILDFMILASTNIGFNTALEVHNAWVAKFEQGYKKATLLYPNDSDFSKFKQVYDETLKKISKEKLARGAKRAGGIISKIAPVLPQVIITVAWIVSLVVLIPLTTVGLDNVGTNAFQLILIIDFVVGAIVMPSVINCGSPIPGIVATIGIIISIVILLPFCSKDLDNVGTNAHQLVLIIEIICCGVMFARTAKKRNNKND